MAWFKIKELPDMQLFANKSDLDHIWGKDKIVGYKYSQWKTITLFGRYTLVYLKHRYEDR